MAALEASLAAVQGEDEKAAATDGKSRKSKSQPRKAKAGAKR
jgi:hypothetical protein